MGTILGFISSLMAPQHKSQVVGVTLKEIVDDLRSEYGHTNSRISISYQRPNKPSECVSETKYNERMFYSSISACISAPDDKVLGIETWAGSRHIPSEPHYLICQMSYVLECAMAVCLRVYRITGTDSGDVVNGRPVYQLRYYRET
jgi:hypothetical protein